MFGLVPVHNHAEFSLEFPAVLPDVEDNGIHAEVVSRLLAAEPGPERIVEENEQNCLVLAQMLVCEWISLYAAGLFEGLGNVTDILYVKK